jgi:trehalose 6-phosphate phosphatase
MYWRDATHSMLRPLLEKAHVGLISDMDGTLSPIVPDPDQAQLTPRNRELLRALQAELALVAVVSGRSVTDLRKRVGLPGVVYVGNHGLERWADGEVVITPEAAAHRPALERVLEEMRTRLLPGMLLEDKGATLSIHYRQTADPDTVAAQWEPIVREIATHHGLKAFQGRMVFELRPPINTDKGTALHHLITDYALDAAVYLGDDTTDVDALRQARHLREQRLCYAVGLGVESDDAPPVVREAADLLLAGISDVEAFLTWLLRARKASSI